MKSGPEPVAPEPMTNGSPRYQLPRFGRVRWFDPRDRLGMSHQSHAG